MTTTKYILHGGFTRKINELNNTFFEEIVKGIEKPKVLMCFFAVIESDRVGELYQELSKRIQDLHPSTAITFMLANQGDFVAQLKTADVLYMHGGNTEQLMGILQSFPTFQDEIAGKIVAGSSAGAYVLVAAGAAHTSEYSRAGLGFVPVRLIAHYDSPELPPNENSVNELLASNTEYEIVKLKDCEWQVFEVANNSNINQVYIDNYGLRGTNFYWHKYEAKGLTKQDILDAGLTSDRVQVHKDIIEPLLRINEAFKARGYELYIKEGYRLSALYDVVYRRRVEKFGKEDTDRQLNMKDKPHALGLSVDVALWDPTQDSEVYMRRHEDGTDALFVDFYKDKSDEDSQCYQELQEWVISIMQDNGFRLGTKREYFHFDYRPDIERNYP